MRAQTTASGWRRCRGADWHGRLARPHYPQRSIHDFAAIWTDHKGERNMPLPSSAAAPQLPVGLDPKRHRAQIEAMIEQLISLLDAGDGQAEDLEPEPVEESGDDEPTDEEDRWVPVSLNVERLPPRQVRSARWLKAQSSGRAM